MWLSSCIDDDFAVVIGHPLLVLQILQILNIN